jgi:glycosyltransferase involved in cell wall biosynthesis
MKKTMLFLTNIKNDYKTKFYVLLHHYYDLTIIYEGQNAKNIKFNEIKSYHKEIFLKKTINEKKVDLRIFNYLFKKYDYIILTNVYTFTAIFSILLLRLLRKKYSIMIDGGLYKKTHSRIKIIIKKIFFSNAQNIFSPSIVSDEYLIKNGANKNQLKRYNFSSLFQSEVLTSPLKNNAKLSIKKQLNIDNNFVFLFVGQFIHRKGIDLLLEISRKLKFDHSFILVGKQGIIRDPEIKNLNFPFNFTILDFMTYEQLKLYYQVSDIFIFPTREEMWGLVVNEALANGLPVITTNQCVAGLTLIKNFINGYIFDLSNLSNLTTMLNIEDNRKMIQSMGEESLESIKLYTIEVMVKQFIDNINS